MKNPTCLLLAVLVSFAGAGCGRNAPPPPGPGPGPAAPAPTDARIPPDLAGLADLPPCPGSVSLEQADGDPLAGSASLLSTLSGAALSDGYVADLLADGWILDSSLQHGNQSDLQLHQGDRFLRIQFSPSDTPAGATRVRLAWGRSGRTAEAQDAYEPEPEEEAPSGAEAGSREW